MTRFTLLFVLLISFQILAAQESYRIYGTVTDGATGETLPGATVFLAETTYGVISGPDGGYELIVQESGTYDLIVRFVGYETFGANIKLINEREIELNMTLQEEGRDLGSFTLTAKDEQVWKEYLRQFKELFLGQTRNANRIKILNEQALDFYLDEERNILYGFADESLKIENKALGYEIEYFLEEFYLDNRNNLTTYLGYTVFTEMEARSSRQQRKWKEARQLAYEGSAQHFFASLYNGNWGDEGFVVNQAKDVTSFGRVLDLSVVDLTKFMTVEGDEISKSISFENFLYITYLNELESREYRSYYGKLGRNATDQVTWIQLNPGYTKIQFDKSGYIYNPLSFYIFGYWGFEKVAEMVPINYQPKQ